jgi:hypothetical protein
MTLPIPQGPQGVTFRQQWIEQFSMPDIGVEFLVGVVAVHVVLLDVFPQKRPAAAKKMTPAKTGLVLKEGFVGGRIRDELDDGHRRVVKVRAETGEE